MGRQILALGLCSFILIFVGLHLIPPSVASPLPSMCAGSTFTPPATVATYSTLCANNLATVQLTLGALAFQKVTLYTVGAASNCTSASPL